MTTQKTKENLKVSAPDNAQETALLDEKGHPVKNPYYVEGLDEIPRLSAIQDSQKIQWNDWNWKMYQKSIVTSNYKIQDLLAQRDELLAVLKRSISLGIYRDVENIPSGNKTYATIRQIKLDALAAIANAERGNR